MDSEKIFQTRGMMSVSAPRSGGIWVLVATLLIGIALAGGVFAWWAMRMTDPVAPPQRTAELLIARGTVRVQGVSETTPHVAKSGDLLEQGMIIMTDADTEAELHFYDASVARLAPETEITLTTLAHDANKPTEDRISITVEIGRVWSRVLNLLSLNAEFTVKSSTTVATVRGTAFDFSVRKDAKGVRWTHVNGADSIVDCKAKKWNGILKKGDWAHVPDQDISPELKKTLKQTANTDKGVVLGDVIPEAINPAWVSENANDDARFLREQKEKRAREEAELVKPFAMPVVGVVLEKIAEQRLERATGEQRDMMLAAWAERNIARANRSAEDGDAEKALRIMDRVKERVESVDVKAASVVQQHIDEAIGRGEVAQKLGDRIIDHMPELKGAEDQSARRLMKSVLIENRLRGLEETGGDASSIDERLFDVDRETNPVLKQRFEYLRERRLEMMRPRDTETLIPDVESGLVKPADRPLEPIAQPILEKPVLAKPIVEPVPLPAPTPAPTPAPAPAPAPLPQPQIIINGPASIQADDVADFTATLVQPDGTKRDVTREGAWSVVGNGSMTGSHYQSAQLAGTDYIVFRMKNADGSDLVMKKPLLVEPHLDINLGL